MKNLKYNFVDNENDFEEDDADNIEYEESEE